jgi:ankyrin repeat protein
MKKLALAVARALVLSLCLSLPAQAGIYDDMLVAIKRASAPDVIDILNRGLDPNLVDREGYTLLMLAVRDGDAEIVDILLAAKANPNARNAFGDTPLRLAAYRGSLPMVEKLVKARALVNTPGWTPTIYAAFNGHEAVVNYLLDNGALIDAQADNGFTALIAAARGGHEAVVTLLLKRGANLNIKSDAGDTAMDYALRSNNTAIYDRLLAAGGRSGQAIDTPGVGVGSTMTAPRTDEATNAPSAK